MSRTDELGEQLNGGRLITDPDVVESYRRDEAHLVAVTPVGAENPCGA